MTYLCKATKEELVLWQTLFSLCPGSSCGLPEDCLRAQLVVGVGAQAAVLSLRVLPVTQRNPTLLGGVRQRCTHLSRLPFAAPCLVPDP